MKVKRALISVYDKKGVVGLAKALASMGVEIISTGGTAELLRKEKIPVKDVSEVTKFPEMLNGRVKTLHPCIHGGLLAIRDNPKHMETIAEHNIKPIDLLVVNLYPFWDAIRNYTNEKDIIEMIDIGGPAMLRSACKNYRYVAALTDTDDYEPVLAELKKSGLVLSEQTLRKLACKVFKQTSAYDSLIYGYFSGATVAQECLPQKMNLEFEKVADLRYGENPHQKGALYREIGSGCGIVNARKIHGKELSFNNMLDLDAAFTMVQDFQEPACAIVKHTNPCGFAVGKDLLGAFRKAYASDPLSAFGSVIGFNGVVDKKTAELIVKTLFVECVIAKDFNKEAVDVFKQKKNLRLLAADPSIGASRCDFKKISGGLLVQERDVKDPSLEDLKVVTELKPKKGLLGDLLLAFRVCRYPKSNTIVIVKNGATIGMGMGQPSRVDSCKTACEKAGKKARGAVMASDGFFPKPDSILLAKKFGISAIIQPGGSIQDEAIIEACNRARIAMVFTGVRHFKH